MVPRGSSTGFIVVLGVASPERDITTLYLKDLWESSIEVIAQYEEIPAIDIVEDAPPVKRGRCPCCGSRKRFQRCCMGG